ncbi:MAG: hypothetical protein ACTIJ9_01430 [Aequorivita sp.]
MEQKEISVTLTEIEIHLQNLPAGQAGRKEQLFTEPLKHLKKTE